MEVGAGPADPKQIHGALFLFKNSSFVDMSDQRVKLEDIQGLHKLLSNLYLFHQWLGHASNNKQRVQHFFAAVCYTTIPFSLAQSSPC